MTSSPATSHENSGALIKPDQLFVVFVHGYIALSALILDPWTEYNDLYFPLPGRELRLPGSWDRRGHSAISQNR